jgi:FG-GAP repeat
MRMPSSGRLLIPAAAGAAASGLALLVMGCSALFPFSVTPEKGADEIRLPPPPRAPVFEGDPRVASPLARKARFGAALAAGHFTRHRHDPRDRELAVGMPGADRGAGAVVRYRKDAAGAETPETLVPAAFGLPDAKGAFGTALVAADFDGDGFDDLAIGAPGHAPGGAVVVVYGGSVRWTLLLPPADASGRRGFGSALAAGKLDRDGIADLVIGEPGSTRRGSDPGRVWVFWGRDGELLTMARSRAIDVPAGDEQRGTTLFGASLAVGNFVARPDRSVPILPDLAIGAPRFDRPAADRNDVGRVYVLRAASAEPALDGFELAVTLEPRDGWERYARQFGVALAAGNFNADTEDGENAGDLAIGAPLSSVPQDDGFDASAGFPQGKAREKGAGLVFLAPWRNGAVSTALRVLSQDRMGLSQKSDNFGWALAAGNFDDDADATDDLAIGSPNERMAGLELSGVKAAGAVFFRFGNPGDWETTGGIPQKPVACFDYIDAVRGLAFSHKGDRFGAVLLAAPVSDDEVADLIVGAPETDVESADGLVKDAGAVWIGVNRETTAGDLEGTFVGDYRDDACGGADAATVTIDVRHREEAVCGTLVTDRDLCYDVDGEGATVRRIDVAVADAGVAGNSIHLAYELRDLDAHRVGSLTADASVVDGASPMTVDLHFRSRDGSVERDSGPVVLMRQ